MLVDGFCKLNPRKLQKLLDNCRSVKVKRLLFWSADRHNHFWLEQIDRDKVDLALRLAGKRCNSGCSDWSTASGDRGFQPVCEIAHAWKRRSKGRTPSTVTRHPRTGARTRFAETRRVRSANPEILS
ncbi:type IV toxin-antitoxin system AbiEi family antitoxin domain-containing protein [Bradyrhizobium sacchari]|nr:type IV toxin-antitoxin system AbiEi family antitoxin domain-containing protein [Bradyrhizobium sacchari]